MIQNLLRSYRCHSLLLALLMLVIGSYGAETVITARDTGGLAISVDGVKCPSLTAWSGADLRGRVGSGGQITGAEIAPLALEFPLVPPVPIQNWISNFCANQHTPHKIVVTEIVDGASVVLPFDDAVLTEVRFSGLDSTTLEPRVTLSIASSFRRKSTAPTTWLAGRPSSAATSFRLDIGRLDTSKTKRIGDLVLKRGAGGQVEFPNLLVWLSAAAGHDWQAWRDAVLGDGSQPASAPRTETGSIGFAASSPQPVPFALQLGGLVILRATPVSSKTNPNGYGSFEVEMLCGSMSVAQAAVIAEKAPLTPTISDTSPAVPLNGTNTAAVPKAALLGAQTATITDKAPLVPAINNSDPLLALNSSNTAVASKTALVGAQATAGDKGARDPADFPRPQGMVRTTYGSNIVPTQTREYARYTATAGYDEMVARYTDLVSAAGWQQAYRTESGDTPKTMLLMTEWHRAQSIAEVRIYGAEQGSEVTVTVTTNK